MAFTFTGYSMTDPIRIELPTIFGMKTVNAYLFLEPEPTLIDCGEKTKACWEKLEEALNIHQLKIQDLQRVIITHAHIDHMGMAAEITRHSKAVIQVSNLAYPWAIDLHQVHRQRKELINDFIASVDDRNPSPIQEAFAQAFGNYHQFWESIPSDRVQVFGLDQPLNFGGRSWEVIHAPGHCHNQVCFYHRPSRQLLSADMLIAKTPTPIVEPYPEEPKRRMKTIFQLLESYQRFSNLEISQVFPGHYEPFSDHRSLIRQQTRRIHLRKETCFALIRDGINDFPSLLNELYNHKIFPPAFTMLVGYLDLLESEGRIEVREESGQKMFYPISLK